MNKTKEMNAQSYVEKEIVISRGVSINLEAIPVDVEIVSIETSIDPMFFSAIEYMRDFMNLDSLSTRIAREISSSDENKNPCSVMAGQPILIITYTNNEHDDGIRFLSSISKYSHGDITIRYKQCM